MNNKWDIRLLVLAKHVSGWSKDPSTKIGAVLADGKHVVSIGYNGLPAGLVDEDKYLIDRNLKYETIIHGEINCLNSAKRDVSGFTLYTYPFLPCSRCASQVIQRGIKRVVSFVIEDERWAENILLSKELFNNCGVEVVEYENTIK